PSRSLVAQNALTAADAILVPTQADYLAVQGLELTFQTALRTQRQSKRPRRRPLPPGCAATRYTAPSGISVLAKEVIEVPDPTHPLHGLRLPCPGVTNKARLGWACIVWLAPGIERVIPTGATSRGGPRPPPSPCRLSAPAIRALLAVLASADTAPTLV